MANGAPIDDDGIELPRRGTRAQPHRAFARDLDRPLPPLRALRGSTVQADRRHRSARPATTREADRQLSSDFARGTSTAASLMLRQIAQQARGHRELRQRQPRAGDLVHRARGCARPRPGAASTQASTAAAPVAPVVDHRGGEPALGVADRIERAVERQPVEIIGDRDAARRASRCGRAGRTPRPRNRSRRLRDRLAGAVGDQHDVGRRGERRQIRRCGAPALPARRRRPAPCARAARAAAASSGSAASSAAVDRRDAVAIVLDDGGEALATDRHCAGTRPGGRAAGPAPRRRARAAACRRILLSSASIALVERGHAVAVAHRGEGGRDRGRRGAGLVGDAHDERRAAAVDHRVGELRGDDLAAQPVLLERVGELLARSAAGNSGRARGRDRDRPAPSIRADRRRARAWHRRAAPQAPAASAAASGGARSASSMSSGRYSTARSSSPRASSVCISRCWKPRSSRPRRSASESASVCR